MVKFRLGVDSSVGLVGEPEAILLGDSVRVIGGDLLFPRSCSRSRGIWVGGVEG